MKKMLIPVLVLAAAGCGKFQEDPLKGQARELGNGRPPAERVDAPEAVSQNMLRLDVLNKFSFKEGRADEYDISARVLAPNYTVEVVIVNIADFPGATYDAITGKMKWTPPAGFILADLSRKLNMLIEATGIPRFAGEDYFKVQRTVEIEVVREPSVPEILSKTNLDWIREGQTKSVEIVVRDADAALGKAPVLDLLPSSSGFNLAPYARVGNPRRSTSSPDQYTFTVSIDLSSAEITRSGGEGAFRFQARSQFQKVSSIENVGFRVYTKLDNALTTWIKAVDFVPAVPRSYNFQIFDPRSEGNLSIRSITGLPAGATINCADRNRQQLFILNCQLDWVAPATIKVEITATVTMRIESRNLDMSDGEVVSTDMQLPLRVIPPPSVPPPGQGPSQPEQPVNPAPTLLGGL